MSYSVGDKFVIEIGAIFSDAIYTTDSIEGIHLHLDQQVLDRLERLDSDYVNEHFGELQDEAYQAGRKAGQEETLKWSKSNEDDFYQAGLNDMCELIKKIHEMGFEEVKEIFSDVSAVGTTPMNIIYSYTPQEMLSKIEAYEQAKKAEIKVGDIVHVKAKNVELIVTRVDTEHRGIYGMNKAGMSQWEDMDNLTKTDRFTEIQGLLDDLN